MFAGKKSAQIREILISESAWEEMTCLFAPSLKNPPKRRVFAFGLVHRWTGQSLVSTEIKWYRINYSGQEEEYFNMLLEGVRIVSISPAMATGDNPNEIPMETVELRYEKITWKHNRLAP